MYGDIHLFSMYNQFMNMMEITAQMRENKKIEFWQDLKEAKKYIDNNIDWEGKN